MKTFLGKKIKDLTPGERYCYKLDKRLNRFEGFYRLRQILLHSIERLCDIFVLLRQRIGRIYDKDVSRSIADSSEQLLSNNELSDAVYSYNSCKKAIRNVMEHGYSSKQAFWISFAIGSLYPKLYEEEDAEVFEIENEIKLSQIFDISFAVYCGEVDKDMKLERSQFFKLLKMNFDLARKIVYEGNPDNAGMELLRFLIGALKATSDSVDDLNPVQLTMAVHYIVGLVEESAQECESFKLIRDV